MLKFSNTFFFVSQFKWRRRGEMIGTDLIELLIHISHLNKIQPWVFNCNILNYINKVTCKKKNPMIFVYVYIHELIFFFFLLLRYTFCLFNRYAFNSPFFVVVRVLDFGIKRITYFNDIIVKKYDSLTPTPEFNKEGSESYIKWF